jgi:multiple sugar transport system substrate-binding protein
MPGCTSDIKRDYSISNEFNWKQCEGSKINVAFNQHPYADSIIKRLPEFEKLTGIEVKYTVTPEEYYYDKLLPLLSRESGSPDVFMAGPMQLWSYIFNGYVESLDKYVSDEKYTTQSYDPEDFFPAVLGSLKWDGVSGHKMGSGSLWGVPLGFEQYNLAYNKRIFAENHLSPPRTVEELMEICETLGNSEENGYYALAIRGSQNWSMITTAYISLFENYGAVDFEVENGQLVSKVNSDHAITMTDLWVKLIKTGAPKEWESYTWYQATADFGAGRAAMLLDADLVAYFQRPQGISKEAENIAWTSMPMVYNKTAVSSHLWCWGLSINSSSVNKEAAWLFNQYFTSKEHLQWGAVNSMVLSPSRQSVFNSGEFQDLIRKADGFVESFKKTVDNATVVFTPQPYFFETTTLWTETVKDIVRGEYASTKEGMDDLKEKMDQIVEDTVVTE